MQQDREAKWIPTLYEILNDNNKSFRKTLPYEFLHTPRNSLGFPLLEENLLNPMSVQISWQKQNLQKHF